MNDDFLNDLCENKEGQKITDEEIDAKMQQHLNLTLQTLKNKLTTVFSSKLDVLVEKLPNIAPHGDYSKLIDDEEGMKNFLSIELTKEDSWKLRSIYQHHSNENWILFVFSCLAVNNGDSNLRGNVIVSKKGIIRHSFVSV